MKKILKALLVSLLFLIFQIQGQQQHLDFKHITIDNGLSSNNAIQFLRDSRGYLWIATGNGLNRYDGYTIKVFLPNPQDSNAIVGIKTIGIDEDDEGNIWVSTDKALNKYDFKRNKFYHTFNGLDSILKGGSSKIFYDKLTKNLWISYEGGIIKYDPKNFTSKNYSHDPNNPKSIRPGGNMVFCQDDNGDIWHANWGNGISKYNIETDDFTHFLHNPDDSTSNLKSPIFDMTFDHHGGLWVGSFYDLDGYTLARLDLATKKFKRFKSGVNNVPKQSFTLSSDNDGNVWLGSVVEGFFKYDRKSNRFFSYKHIAKEVESISENRVVKIYFDKLNYLWVGTPNKGVNMIDLKLKDIVHYSLPRNASSVDLRQVYFISEDDKQNIWLATGNGLFRLDVKNNSFKLIDLGEKKLRVVNAVHNGLDGYMWAACENQIYRVNAKTLEAKHYTNKFLPINNISRIAVDKWQNKYICTGKELYVFEKGNLSKAPKIVINVPTSENLSFNHLYEDGDEMFFAVQDFLYKINTKSFKYEELMRAFEDKGQRYFKITFIEKVEKNKFKLYSTLGVLEFNSATNEFKEINYPFLKYDEVSPRTILFGKQKIYVSTYRGIFLYDLNTKKFFNPHIFNPDQLNPDVVYQANNERIYIAASDGVLSFDPQQLFDIPLEKPQIIIDDFYLFNSKVPIGAINSPLKKVISESEEIILTHDQVVFSLELSLLNIDEVSKNKYSYILEGFETHWNHIGNRKVVTYTSLPAGVYVFKYMGIDKNGIESDIKSLKITILPPFWETIWFRMLVILLIAIIIYGVFRWRIMIVQRQKLKLQVQVKQRTAEIEKQKEMIQEINEELSQTNEYLVQLNQEKTDLISIVSHDLKAPLNRAEALIGLIQMEIEHVIHFNKDLFDMLSKEIRDEKALITDILSMEELDSKLSYANSDNLNLTKLVGEIVNSYVNYAQSKNIQLHLEIAEKEVFILGDELHLKRVLENLLSNAIKFSPHDKSVYVQLKDVNNSLELSIRDEGPGFSEADKEHMFKKYAKLSARPTGGENSTGLGLTIVKKIVENMKANLRLESSEGQGATFTLIFKKSSFEG